MEISEFFNRKPQATGRVRENKISVLKRASLVGRDMESVNSIFPKMTEKWLFWPPEKCKKCKNAFSIRASANLKSGKHENFYYRRNRILKKFFELCARIFVFSRTFGCKKTLFFAKRRKGLRTVPNRSFSKTYFLLVLKNREIPRDTGSTFAKPFFQGSPKTGF